MERDLTDPAQREFGDYELLERIDQGGMGVVYRARQSELDREVAIKLLSAGAWASSDFVVRFRHEAQNAARLQHPGIVSIFEMGEFDGLLYYAMQLVRGDNLAKWLQAPDALPTPRNAALLTRHVAESVAYAHSLGVLHLDLKPGNILIDEDGHPVVADFGLARRIGTGITELEGLVAGTPGYMAPEQSQPDQPLTQATDVWGIGTILRSLLTAQAPPDLRAICTKCLASSPADRYADARALADDLGHFLEGRPVAARRLNWMQRIDHWRKREPRIAMIAFASFLAVLCGLVFSLWMWQRAERSAADARAQTWRVRGNTGWDLVRNGRPFDAMPSLLANLREREAHGDVAGAALERLRLGTLQQTNLQMIDAFFASSPGIAVILNRDGTRVAVSTGEEDVRMYDTRDGHELWKTNTLDASHFWQNRQIPTLGFTHDERYLIAERQVPGFLTQPTGHDNILIDASNGRIIMPPAGRFADFRDATYSADGRFALLRNNKSQTQLFRVDNWHAVSPLRSVDPVNGFWRVGDDGRFVAQSLRGRIELRDPRTLGIRHVLQNRIPDGIFPVWAVQPRGDLLAFGTNDHQVQVINIRTLSVRTFNPSPYVRLAWLSFSADGRWLTAAARNQAFVWDVASGIGGVLPEARHDISRVDADVDSGTVLVTAPPEAMLWQLPARSSSYDLATRVLRAWKLTAQLPIGTNAWDHSATFAPAARLAATINIDGELRLWRWRASPMLSAHPAPQIAAGLYFDGRHAAVADGNNAWVISVADEHPASPVFAHSQPVASAQLAADGRALVTSSGRELHVYDWHTGRLRFPPIVLENSPLRVETDPQARILLVSTGMYRNGVFQELLSSYDLHSGHPLATRIPVPGPLNGVRFSRDGRHLLCWRHGEVAVRDASTLLATGRNVVLGPDIDAALRRVFTLSGWRPDAASKAELTGTPVLDAALDRHARRLTVLTSASEFADSELLQFDLDSGRRLSRRSLGKGRTLGLLAHGDAYDTVQWLQDDSTRLLGSAGNNLKLQQTARIPGKTQAISDDGRLLANASHDDVVLADRASGEWAAAPLPAPLSVSDDDDDGIVQLVFAPDGSSLLARTHHRRWLWWPLAQERRPVAQLQASQDRLFPGAAGNGSAAQAITGDARADWRKHDPGPPRNAALSTPSERIADTVSRANAPPGYAFVDLSPAASHAATLWNGIGGDEDPQVATLATGVQRYLGIDYDIHKIIWLSLEKSTQLPSTSPIIPLPTSHFDGVHLLAGSPWRLQDMNSLLKSPFGYLDLNYADGGHARIPIVYGRDLLANWADGGSALPIQIAWVETGPQPTIGRSVSTRLYAFRLTNPYPQRAVSSISFSASKFAWSAPVIFAATLETGT